MALRGVVAVATVAAATGRYSANTEDEVQQYAVVRDTRPSFEEIGARHVQREAGREASIS